MNTRDAVAQIMAAMEGHGIKAEHEADGLVSTQVEPSVTCDVEFDRGTGLYTVWLRAWDPTGGLASETEIGAVRRARYAVALVADVHAEASYGEDDDG